ncbi:MAG: DUF1801 domain-containing protein [Bacteroidota bacterium]
MNTNVDFYFNKAKIWQEELKTLRQIILDCNLTEELKWGVPCYTLKNKNVLLIHAFKNYCAILFVKGILLKDANHILIQQTINVQAGRQIRFTNIEEIKNLEPVLKKYINEAIDLERSGKKTTLSKNTELVFPEEFENKLKENPSVKIAFDSLTPGRQRAYNLFFTAPKQSKTRSSRIEKCIPQIMNGKGLND